jgi:hypothetical protein
VPGEEEASAVTEAPSGATQGTSQRAGG